jgi:hypothetical protein
VGDIDAFLAQAQVQGATFEATRQQHIVLQSTAFVRPEPLSPDQVLARQHAWAHLRVPRRPTYVGRTHDEFVRAEQDAFLAWALAPGRHGFRLEWFNKTGGFELDLGLGPVGGTLEPARETAFAHED